MDQAARSAKKIPKGPVTGPHHIHVVVEEGGVEGRVAGTVLRDASGGMRVAQPRKLSIVARLLGRLEGRLQLVFFCTVRQPAQIAWCTKQANDCAASRIQRGRRGSSAQQSVRRITYHKRVTDSSHWDIHPNTTYFIPARPIMESDCACKVIKIREHR